MRLKRLLAALAVVLVSLGVAVSISPSAAFADPDPVGYNYVQGKESLKCMTAHGAGPYVNGTVIDLFTCIKPTPQDNQQWYFTPAIPGQPFYFIQMKNTTKCVTVAGGASQNGAPLVLWDCDYPSLPSQQIFERAPSGFTNYPTLATYGTAGPYRCASVHGGGSVNNTAIDLWDCLGQSNQAWGAFLFV